ncbi:MAG TPA: DUF1254 domain-containing protein [Gammaproteobacteria bacterium]|nr:hypothetical protein BMS3Abin11_01515 [bacterium BMS3Abin11]HDH15575.1 DUF1254 domain-containing protein [Gammaproteobacteria bacterium]
MKPTIMKVFIYTLTLIAWLPLATASAKTDNEVSEQEAYEIAVEAYLYLYPIISMDVTRRVITNLPAGKKSGFGPENAFHHKRTFPSADSREVVRPNFDTLYSFAWLNLTKEPMVVSTQDTHGRYFMLEMLGMWTDAFAVPGSRTSGNKAQHYAVVPQGWNGDLPKGMESIVAPTPYVWIVGRTQTNGVKDYEAVHKVQDGFKITPLSQWGGKNFAVDTFKNDPGVDMKTPPAKQVEAMVASKYFSYGAELMKVNKPHVTDWSILARLERIGIVAGESFDFAKASPVVKKALERAIVDTPRLMQKIFPTVAPVINGWQMNTSTMGVYGNSYMKRAIVALIGLGANQPEDAIYPINISDADGNPVEGNNQYVMHFTKAKLPPVEAFWSLTMYDAAGFQVANKLNRFALGDRDKLKYNADGSLDIYIQHKSPGKDRESNWLPSPDKGTLGLTMRLYAPKSQVLDGRWVPPVVKKM